MVEETISATKLKVDSFEFSQTLVQKTPESDVIFNAEPVEINPAELNAALTILQMCLPEPLSKPLGEEVGNAMRNPHSPNTLDINRLSGDTLNMAISFAGYLRAITSIQAKPIK